MNSTKRLQKKKYVTTKSNSYLSINKKKKRKKIEKRYLKNHSCINSNNTYPNRQFRNIVK